MTQDIFTAADFDHVLNNYAGRIITHTPAVRTVSNITGEAKIADGTAVTIKAYFMRTSQKWNYDKMGFMQQGDAVMLAKYADGVVKNDKITVEGKNFRVKEAYSIPGTFDSTGTGTSFTYTTANLFLEEWLILKSN